MRLYNHQQEAIDFAVSNNGRCALFHDPGLGKTRTGLEIFRRYRSRNSGLKLLVVCPLSLINSAWGGDIKQFTSYSHLPFKKLKGKLPDIIIINFEALISKKNLPVIGELVSEHDFMCIVDESSRMKNSKSMTTKTLLKLADEFVYRIVASGTPMPNSEEELWGQMRFVSDTVFNKSFYAFKNEYFHLEREGEVRRGDLVSSAQRRFIFSAGWKYAITDDSRKALMSEIEPFAHWVRKEDALDLPEKVDETRDITLSAKERKVYNEIRDQLAAEINGEMVTAEVALKKLMKLRQITSGFVYSEESMPIWFNEIEETFGDVKYKRSTSSKLKELARVFEELGSRQAIIWCQFHSEIKAIEYLVSKKAKKTVVTLYAGTKDKDDSISRFKSGEAQYLIAHPKSAAHGLTFVNCTTSIFYSLSYSSEEHIQARDRVHRIGQTKSCLYIYLVATNTIDEELIDTLNNKQELQDIIYHIVGKRAKGKSVKDVKARVPECVGV